MFSFRHKSYFWQDWDLLRVMCSRQEPSEFLIDRYSHGGDFVTGLFSVFFSSPISAFVVFLVFFLLSDIRFCGFPKM